MKGKKTVAVTALAVMAVALAVTSAYALHIGGFGASEETVSTILSYPTQSTDSSLVTYGNEPVLTTATEVTNPIYYPTCICGYGYGTTDGYTGYGYGPGYGWGCGGHGRGGCWGYGYGAAPIYGTTAPLTISQAVSAADEYLTSLNNPNLAIVNVQEYATVFRFSLYEKSTGVGACEMTINKYTGYVLPAMGPSIAWNTKYGIINGALTVYNASATATMPVTAAQAQTFAQQYLATVMPATTGGSANPFYGYYNVEVLSSGNTYGIISVNGYTGQIWYQAWLGSFIQQATA